MDWTAGAKPKSSHASALVRVQDKSKAEEAERKRHREAEKARGAAGKKATDRVAEMSLGVSTSAL